MSLQYMLDSYDAPHLVRRVDYTPVVHNVSPWRKGPSLTAAETLELERDGWRAYTERRRQREAERRGGR